MMGQQVSRLPGPLLAVLTLALLWPPLLNAGAARVPIVDLHVDLSYQFNYKHNPFERGSGEVVASELEQSGVRGVVLPLYVPREVSESGPRLVDLEQSYAAVFGALLKTPPYALPGCREQQRSVSTWLSFEGAAPLADHPELVPVWIARGVRLFGLVHSYDNELAGSSGEPQSRRRGLSARGRTLAARILELGGVLDVSHASDRSTDELIELAREAQRPIVASHSNARALAPHPRNLTDAQIRSIAATGGVIGINVHQRFLAPHGASASLADLLRQVQHLVRVAGIDHVALGSDYEGGIRPVAGLETMSRMQHLAEALRAAGLSEGDVSKIFHENALRVLCPSARETKRESLGEAS